MLPALALGAASSAMNLVGGIMTNNANRDMQRENRRWEEEMANSAYQRAVADMTKAGLNPALMYGKGGPSDTPSVAPPTFNDPTKGMDLAGLARFGGLDLPKLALEKQVADAQTVKILEEAGNVSADSELKRAALPVALRAPEKFGRELKLLDKDIELRGFSAKSEEQRLNWETLRGRFFGDLLSGYDGAQSDVDAFAKWLKSFFTSDPHGKGQGDRNGGPNSARRLEDNMLKR